MGAANRFTQNPGNTAIAYYCYSSDAAIAKGRLRACGTKPDPGRHAAPDGSPAASADFAAAGSSAS